MAFSIGLAAAVYRVCIAPYLSSSHILEAPASLPGKSAWNETLLRHEVEPYAN